MGSFYSHGRPTDIIKNMLLDSETSSE